MTTDEVLSALLAAFDLLQHKVQDEGLEDPIGIGYVIALETAKTLTKRSMIAEEHYLNPDYDRANLLIDSLKT